jgi:hypothetical protein
MRRFYREVFREEKAPDNLESVVIVAENTQGRSSYQHVL